MFEDEYESLDAIPSQVKHLFAKTGDVYKLIPAGSIRSQDDIDRIQEGLRKEREDHKETKRKLNAFNGVDPEEIHTKLDRIAELEAAAGGKLDEGAINQMVETRLRSRVAPLERQIATLTNEKAELQTSVGTYQKNESRRVIHDHIRKAGTASKMRETAIDDALLLGESVFMVDEHTGRVVTRDNIGVTPGLEPTVWLTEMKQSRQHWWPESEGAGAKGGKGNPGSGSNPFSADGWNLTEQGAVLKADRSLAEQMAKSAGTTIGGPRPLKK